VNRNSIVVALLLASCASTAIWEVDLPQALAASSSSGQDLVVYFALPGREASDRMQASLSDPAVSAALRDGGFRAAVADGSLSAGFYSRWVGGGSEGMGIAVLDAAGQAYAARPGPQDPPELAAFLRQSAALRVELAALRAAAATQPANPHDQYRLGCLLLQLGCRTECEPLLRDAAMGGIAGARHHLARLFALDGNVEAARQWLVGAPRTPAAQVTEGYVLFKERKHEAAAAVFEAALSTGQLADDRQRALLYLGKALHENKQDDRAVPLLKALAAEDTGSTFEAAAVHTLGHILQPQHGHTH
jgi:tetratricopeptide (TPR) repeat protein